VLGLILGVGAAFFTEGLDVYWKKIGLIKYRLFKFCKNFLKQFRCDEFEK
jgi:hypothetical protein